MSDEQTVLKSLGLDPESLRVGLESMSPTTTVEHLRILPDVGVGQSRDTLILNANQARALRRGGVPIDDPDRYSVRLGVEQLGPCALCGSHHPASLCPYTVRDGAER